MDEATQQQVDDLWRVRKAHERRLAELEVSAAITGRATEVSITIEIQDIKVKVSNIDRAIRRLHQREADVLASILTRKDDEGNVIETSVEDRLDAIANYTLGIETSLHKEMGALILMLDDTDREEREERKRRQKKTDRKDYIIIGLMVLVVLVLLLT